MYMYIYIYLYYQSFKHHHERFARRILIADDETVVLLSCTSSFCLSFGAIRIKTKL